MAQAGERDAGALLRQRRQWLLWAAPALIASAYALAVLIQFPSIINSIYLDSDTAVAPVIAHLMGSAPAGSHAVIGNHAWYEEYLFMRLSSGLPFYRVLWELAPLVWSIGGLALLGWTALLALGRFGALTVVCALACVGAFGRLAFLTLDWHGLTALHTIIICWALVWLAGTDGELPWGRVVALASAIGAISVLAASGDQLFIVWALLPLLATAVAVGWRGGASRARRMIVFALLVGGIALGGGAALASLMRAAGVDSAHFSYHLVAHPHNLLLLLEGLTEIGGGDFLGQGSPSLSVIVSGALLLTALAVGLIAALGSLRRMAVSPHAREHERRADQRFAYVAFWTASLLSASGAFVLTSTPVNGVSGRYLLGGYLAIGALVGALTLRGPRWRAALALGVSVFALSATYQVLSHPRANATGAPAIGDSAAIERFASEQHVRYGFASYWNAPALTWATHFSLDVFPVAECGPLGRLCPGNISISSWYRPRPGTRSLLILAPDLPELPIKRLDPALGAPLASRSFGSLEVYVFPYDIASRLAGIRPRRG